jgi:hypothetical protein
MIRLNRVIPSGTRDLTLAHLIIRGRLCDRGKCVRSFAPNAFVAQDDEKGAYWLRSRLTRANYASRNPN